MQPSPIMLRSSRACAHEYEQRPHRVMADNRFKEQQALVQRAKRGDRAAFAQIYDEFVDRIYRYVYYKVGNTNDAEDLTAQVFMKAWRAIEHYQATGKPLAAWLYRIAHNQVVDHFRTRHETAPLEDAQYQVSDFDVEEVVFRHAHSQLLREAIGQLTPDQQDVIVLRFLEGWNAEETAQIMGKSTGAVRTLQHRALVCLNRIIAVKSE